MIGYKKGILVTLIVVFSLMSLVITASAKDCDCKKKLSYGDVITLESTVLKETRHILVHTPAGYDTTGTRYPVLYILDAKTHFKYAAGMVDFLSANGIIPPMILAGVVNTDRSRDFSLRKTEKIPNGGGADNFISFMREELIPYVEQNYRTEPYRILFGHSLCGLFSVYSLISSPDLMNAYLAASPWLKFDEGFLGKNAETSINPKSQFNNFLYMTVGDEPEVLDYIKDFDALLQEKDLQGLEWYTKVWSEEDHGSITFDTLYKGLKTVYANWKASDEVMKSGIKGLEKHYQKLSKKYGYQITIPEYHLNIIGYKYMSKKDNAKAIEILKLNVKNYPESANVYDSLGEAYEADGQYELAAKNYEIAIKMAAKSKHYYLDTYKEHLMRVKEKTKK